MQSKCPRCNSKMSIKRFLSPVAVVGYNNIDDDVYICGKCNAYIEWTSNRKIAVVLAYAFCALYLFVGTNVVSSLWFFKVFIPSIVIPVFILLFFPNQTKVREEKDYSSI